MKERMLLQRFFLAYLLLFFSLSRFLSLCPSSFLCPNNLTRRQDGALVQFKTKRTTQLKKLMKAYCERMNREFGRRVEREMIVAASFSFPRGSKSRCRCPLPRAIPVEAEAVVSRCLSKEQKSGGALGRDAFFVADDDDEEKHSFDTLAHSLSPFSTSTS